MLKTQKPTRTTLPADADIALDEIVTRREKEGVVMVSEQEMAEPSARTPKRTVARQQEVSCKNMKQDGSSSKPLSKCQENGSRQGALIGAKRGPMMNTSKNRQPDAAQNTPKERCLHKM
jgi:hypothetical protein